MLGQDSRRATTSSTPDEEIADADGQEQVRLRRRAVARCGPASHCMAEQHQRHQQPIEVDQADDAPGEIARSGER